MYRKAHIDQRAKARKACLFPFVLLCVFLLLCGVADAAEKEKEEAGVIVRAPYWLRAGEIIKDMPEAFGVSQSCPAGADTISVGLDDYASIGRFADKDHPFDVLIYNDLPNASQAKILSRQFPKAKPQPERLFVGQHELAHLVLAGNIRP